MKNQSPILVQRQILVHHPVVKDIQCRFKQIKEAEAMRRKQLEEAGIRAEEKITMIEQESKAKLEGKKDDVNSGNHERNGHLSNKTNGLPYHNSTKVEQDESPEVEEEEEMESEEMRIPPAFANSESVDKRDQAIEKDEA
ncbi:hypothetical protein KSP39_PZI011280 [Platanthera zijinensis]|uniref:Uncharacterized protein n=1 Tax=Platanthera zijinensis TaxID=2320716 RepID=A0AAP0BGB3_9ASPA